MRPPEVIALIKFLDQSKVKAADKFFVDKMLDFSKKGIFIDGSDSRRLQEIYRYTVGGGERQDQQFKRYVRPKSWGV